MAVEALKVTASYDPGNLDKGLNNLQKELVATSVAANKLDSTLAKGVVKGSNSAAFALQNLGRVAQDAPFGFIGIANNINPLVESFQRLKKESGSTGGALKALVGSLAGAGGVGLAFSLVTAAVSFASIGMQAWKSRTKEAGSATETAAEANKKYKDSLDGIFANVAKEATQVVSLIAVLKSETETRERKLGALKELQKINPEIFKGLTLEKGAVQNLDAAYIAYIASLKTVIAVKLKQAQIEKEIEKLLKLQGAEQTTQQKNIIKGAEAFLQSEKKRINALGGTTFNPNQIEINIKDKELRDTQARIEDFTKQLTDLSTGVDIKIGEGKTKNVKNITTIKDVLAELSRELDFLNAKGIAFNTNEGKAKISAYFGTIEKLIKDFKVAPDDQLITKLFGKASSIKAAMATQELQKVVSGAAESLANKPIVVPVIPVISLKAIDTFLVDATETVAAAMEGLFENIAISIGDTLGRVLSGSASIGDFFTGIFSQLGASMQELGKFFIQTGIQIKLIKSFLIKNPALAIAGGIALVALGGLIKAKTSTPGFATGGITGGGSILVGERGPEILTPPRGSSITPNAQTNALLGGGMSGGRVIFKIDGRTLVGVLEQTNDYLGRNGQRR